MMIKIPFVIILFFTSVVLAQEKIDSLFKTQNHFDLLNDLEQKPPDNRRNEDVLPLQYLQMEIRKNKLDEKFLLNNKLLQAEIEENYFFDKDELSCGLSDNELIAYMKNKKETLRILSDSYSQRADVNWDKIQRILHLTKTTAAIILGILNLIRYH